MIRYFCTILTLLCLGHMAFPQGSYFEEPVDSVRHTPPKLAFKLVPTQLLWRYPAYTFAFEHSLKGKGALEYKLGVIQDRDVFEDDAEYFANKSGFKSTLTLKRYDVGGAGVGSLFDLLNGRSSYRGSVRSYLGFELVYNRIKFDRTRTFRFDCGDGCEFFQRTTYGIKRTDIGGRLNLGVLVELVAPVYVEFTWSAGFLYQQYREDDRKPKDFSREFGRIYRENFEGMIPSLNFEGRLVFEIK